jgi:hypothetical protein
MIAEHWLASSMSRARGGPCTLRVVSGDSSDAQCSGYSESGFMYTAGVRKTLSFPRCSLSSPDPRDILAGSQFLAAKTVSRAYVFALAFVAIRVLIEKFGN